MSEVDRWQSFQDVYRPLIKELEGEVDALERLVATLRQHVATYQELIDCANEIIEKGGKL